MPKATPICTRSEGKVNRRELTGFKLDISVHARLYKYIYIAK